MEKPTAYKFCLVPECKNTNRKTPNKIFFRLPTCDKVRKQWCKVMKRANVSPTSCLYCCEDHFNVKEDTRNYIQYTIMKQQGLKCSLRLKDGVVPHIFWCRKNMPPPVERTAVVKRQRLALVNEALAEYAKKSSREEISETKFNAVYIVNKPAIELNATNLEEMPDPISSPDIEASDQNVKANVEETPESILNPNCKVEPKEECIEDDIEDADCLVPSSTVEPTVESYETARYSEELKSLALTIYFYSPETYSFLSGLINLPNLSMSKRLLASPDSELTKEVVDFLNKTQKPNS